MIVGGKNKSRLVHQRQASAVALGWPRRVRWLQATTRCCRKCRSALYCAQDPDVPHPVTNFRSSPWKREPERAEKTSAAGLEKRSGGAAGDAAGQWTSSELGIGPGFHVTKWGRKLHGLRGACACLGRHPHKRGCWARGNSHDRRRKSGSLCLLIGRWATGCCAAGFAEDAGSGWPLSDIKLGSICRRHISSGGQSSAGPFSERASGGDLFFFDSGAPKRKRLELRLPKTLHHRRFRGENPRRAAPNCGSCRAFSIAAG